MSADNVIVLSFSILFVIYAVIEIINIVSNIKVKNTYIEYRCKDYVEIKKKELEEEIQHFNRKPVLAVIQIDNDQASNSYIKGKKKDCDEIGIEMRHVNIHSNIAEQKEVEGIIKVIVNSDADGIIIQLPIPDKSDSTRKRCGWI